MSKNFEREYREYLNAQAPDLWNRIEAGIDADVTGAGTISAVPVADADRAVASKNKKRKKSARYYRLIASAAACVAALCLIVPVYRLVNGTNAGEKNMATAEEMVLTDATISNTVEENYDEAGAGDGGEQPAAEAAMPEVAAEEEAAEEEMVESSLEGESTTSQNPAAAEHVTGIIDGDNDDTIGLASDNGGESAPSKEGSIRDFSADPQVQLYAEIIVLAEKEKMETGILYEAMVTEKEQSDFKAGENLKIFLPAENGISMEENVAYGVTLQKGAEEGYYTVVVVE